MSFAQRLRDQRRERDLSQLELADKAGCSLNTIRKLESDERRPSRELAIRLAAVLELPPARARRLSASRTRLPVGPHDSAVADDAADWSRRRRRGSPRTAAQGPRCDC
jgi:transcriptional regulator with XRE-family HTH domain